ncbi:embryogenesis-like protein [Typha latifolia]|uniref:embryogenesis-like protein n=1 Tax=Typha latifolia TaxID=4733 RepID=UPI003C2B0265
MQRNARSLLQKSISQYPLRCSARPISPSLPRIPLQPPKHHLCFLPISTFRSAHQLFDEFPATYLSARFGFRRSFSNGESIDHSNEVDEINAKFAEAREEIDAALESKETVYFNEEAECARDAVKVVLDMFDGLLAKLPEKERMALQRSMGLKMEQLKAELKQLDE